MHFVDFPGTNFAFTKPQDMKEDQCGTLRVKRGVVDLNGDKFPVSTSGWQPSEDDLKRLNEGGLIYLTVFGPGHPPVNVATELMEMADR